jgi:predicted acylesterase/phospholipase RssA
MLAVGERCMRIEVHSKVMEQARFCDKLVGPNELHRYGTFDFDEADEIFAIGYKTGTEQVREIINKLEI